MACQAVPRPPAHPTSAAPCRAAPGRTLPPYAPSSLFPLPAAPAPPHQPADSPTLSPPPLIPAPAPPCAQIALAQIRDNREAVDRIVEVLCEKETLTGDEFREILSKYATIPAENIAAAQLQKQKQMDVVVACEKVDLE